MMPDIMPRGTHQLGKMYFAGDVTLVQMVEEHNFIDIDKSSITYVVQIHKIRHLYYYYMNIF